MNSRRNLHEENFKPLLDGVYRTPECGAVGVCRTPECWSCRVYAGHLSVEL